MEQGSSHCPAAGAGHRQLSAPGLTNSWCGHELGKFSSERPGSGSEGRKRGTAGRLSANREWLWGCSLRGLRDSQESHYICVLVSLTASTHGPGGLLARSGCGVFGCSVVTLGSSPG